jgi:hypothetical protein
LDIAHHGQRESALSLLILLGLRKRAAKIFFNPRPNCQSRVNGCLILTRLLWDSWIAQNMCQLRNSSEYLPNTAEIGEGEQTHEQLIQRSNCRFLQIQIGFPEAWPF